MSFKPEIESFISQFLTELREQNVAIFAGAGLSVGSGFVDWKSLLEDFATELGLDIKRESDLLSLIQYHINKNLNNRSSLNDKITREFHHGKQPNVNHGILARLPITTYWTTNYDKLIEIALDRAKKVVDVKYTTPHLAKTVHGRDVILYKMHGDVEHPELTIITKDEYEKYYLTHGAYINALSGDLISKTFLFIGFSFTDPNLEFVLSRIRVVFQNNSRHHYCLFRELKIYKDEIPDDFEYRKLKQTLAIEDLKRFNIRVLMLREYEEITEILREIEKRYAQNTVYLSGSAVKYGKWNEKEGEEFISILSQQLIKNEFKIISGFGLGVGSSVVNGVLKEIYLNRGEKLKDQLILRPFPLGEDAKHMWQEYREDMISYAGVAIFLFGNKLDRENIFLADGVRKEFDIAHKSGKFVIPIGATEYMARELWTIVYENYSKYFPENKGLKLFEKLGDASQTKEELVSSVIEFLKIINQ